MHLFLNLFLLPAAAACPWSILFFPLGGVVACCLVSWLVTDLLCVLFDNRLYQRGKRDSAFVVSKLVV
jgi:hypothetical protein